MTTMTFGRQILWGVAAAASTGLALWSYRYLGNSDLRAAQVLANFFARPWLVIHVLAATTALLCGSVQLLPAIRRRWPVAHRRVGRIYMIACLIGGPSGAILAFGSTAGPWVTLGFGGLGTVWTLTSALAWRAALQQRFADHRAWAIRSWALTFTAVTFRLYLPIFPMLGLPFIDGYRAASVYCWLVNLVIAECYLRRGRRPVVLRPALAG